MSDLSDAAMRAHAYAVPLCGKTVTIQRLSGQAPNVTSSDALVPAVTLNDTSRKSADGGQDEAISQNYRQFIVLQADLAAAGFPLPIEKDDKVVLPGATHKLNITNADDTTRQLAGAILITASGIA